MKRYSELAKAAKRLSLNFRFHKDNARPDNRAIRDLERLVYFLKNNMEKNHSNRVYG